MKTFRCFAAIAAVVTIASAAAGAPIRLRSETFDPKSSAHVAAAADVGQGALCLVQFKGPIQASWKTALGSLGIELLDYIPDYTYIARLSGQQAAKARQMEFVDWVGRLDARHRIHPELRGRGDDSIEVVIRLLTANATNAVQNVLATEGGLVDTAASSGAFLTRKP